MLNMFPLLPSRNFAYMALLRIKHFCQFFLRLSGGVKGPNLFNIFLCKLGCSSAFFDHVDGIITLSPKKKVLRSYASRIVAFVKYAKAFWNFSEVNFPRNSMCGFHLISQSEPSIALRLARCAPFITAVEGNKDYLIPESLLNFFGVNHGK